jgi:hypothetical protein
MWSSILRREFCILLQKLTKVVKKFSIVAIRAQNRSRSLRNTNQNCYHCTQTLCEPTTDSVMWHPSLCLDTPSLPVSSELHVVEPAACPFVYQHRQNCLLSTSWNTHCRYSDQPPQQGNTTVFSFVGGKNRCSTRDRSKYILPHSFLTTSTLVVLPSQWLYSYLPGHEEISWLY